MRRYIRVFGIYIRVFGILGGGGGEVRATATELTRPLARDLVVAVVMEVGG